MSSLQSDFLQNVSDCHEMYGVTFIQRFGWYVQQAYLRQGILPSTTVYLPDVTPAEFVEDIRVLREAQAQRQEALRWFRRASSE